MKRKYENDIIVVVNGFKVGDILNSFHKKHYDLGLNKIRIRAMFNKTNIVNTACEYMKHIGYVKEIRKKEILVVLKSGGKIKNIEYQIELINKFHKFNDED